MNCINFTKLVKNTSIFRKKKKEIHGGLKYRCVNSCAICPEGPKQPRSSCLNVSFTQSKHPRCRCTVHLLPAIFIQRCTILMADTIHTGALSCNVCYHRQALFILEYYYGKHSQSQTLVWMRESLHCGEPDWYLISPALCSVTLKSASPLWFGFSLRL